MAGSVESAASGNPVDDYRERPLCRPYRPPAPPALWAGMVQALTIGVLSAQALPPRHWWWLLPFTLGWLLWLLNEHLKSMPTAAARARRAAALLFAFGLGWHALGVWWITEAFQVDAARYALMAPFAVGLLAAAMAAFTAAAGAVAGLLWNTGSAQRACLWRPALLAVLMTVADAARGMPLAFGGFAWNPFAVVLDPETLLPLMQGAYLFGIWGFSALLLWLCMLPGQTLYCLRWQQAPRAAPAMLALGLALLAGLWTWGSMRVNAIATAPPPADAPWLVIVQPSVPQREKWKPENRNRIFQDLLALSREGMARARKRCERQGGCNAPVIVIWPESAVPFLLDASPRALAMIADMLPDNAWLFTGALRQIDQSRRRPDGPRLHNSILAIDSNGQVRLRYDKRRLVPFGEYVPLASVLRPLGVRKLVPFRHGFLPGRNLGPHHLPGLPPFEAFICYEIIYHDRPARGANETRWLLNVTNDAWFGGSAGPWQHLQQARYHAIARGLPLARAANDGISVVMNAAGRDMARLGLFKRGVIVERLPLAATD